MTTDTHFTSDQFLDTSSWFRYHFDLLKAKKNINSEEIAELLGYSREHLSRIYNSKKEPSANLIHGLALALGVPTPNFVLGSTKNNTQHPIYYLDSEDVSNNALIVNEMPSNYKATEFFIPTFNDCDIAINIAGNDMEPIFYIGDVVLCNKVVDFELVNFGDPHLVVTGELVLVKYLFPSKDHKSYLLKSANNHYPDWTLKIEKVKYLYRIKGVLRRKIM